MMNRKPVINRSINDIICIFSSCISLFFSSLFLWNSTCLSSYCCSHSVTPSVFRYWTSFLFLVCFSFELRSCSSHLLRVPLLWVEFHYSPPLHRDHSLSFVLHSFSLDSPWPNEKHFNIWYILSVSQTCLEDLSLVVCCFFCFVCRNRAPVWL